MVKKLTAHERSESKRRGRRCNVTVTNLQLQRYIGGLIPGLLEQEIFWPNLEPNLQGIIGRTKLFNSKAPLLSVSLNNSLS